MSETESEVLLPVVPVAISAAKGAETPSAPAVPELVESDFHQTVIPYDPNGGVPYAVIALWIAAFIGLGLYTFVYLVPDYLKWLRL